MNLYHISQTAVRGYDTYSDAVVAAESEEAARLIHPDDSPMGEIKHKWDGEHWNDYGDATWSRPDRVNVMLLGTAIPSLTAGVICASFHAG